MPTFTRHAVRVCAALIELKGRGGDVLDALIPFFEPILELSNGKIFDPDVFAIGVQKLYSWRFTTDIAENFIPRLERAGFLERVSPSVPRSAGRQSIYIVRYSKRDDSATGLTQVLNDIIDEFESFPPLVTNLLTYNKTRDELTEILIKFLVSLDAYAPAEFAAEVKRLKIRLSEDTTIGQLEEGGEPLSQEDRYMAARFVQTLCKERPEYVADLSWLASVGLLTEVVEDFVKPVQLESRTDLTIILDAPIALDYLGCSGLSFKNDASSILDSLRETGCRLVALPVTCDEMRRNLRSMLNSNPGERYGYTHNAIVKKEVLIEYVQAVANNPEQALTKAGVTVIQQTLSAFPSQHQFFPTELYEDFLSSISWVEDIRPREHDATCLALTMRLRSGRNSADLFRSKYVFVTRNGRFVRDSREYCLQSRLIGDTQEGAVIHQRELATIAWLRTGLGASESVPRSHLLAICDRVLNLRKEVRDTVGAKIKSVTPDKYQQFELLLLDQKSIRRLADLTLNDEKIITDQNAEELLEAMRSAAIEEERAKFNKRLRQDRADMSAKLVDAQQQAALAQQEADNLIRQRDEVVNQLTTVLANKLRHITNIIFETNRTLRCISVALSWVIFMVAAMLISNWFFSWLGSFPKLNLILAVITGAFGIYHQLANALELRKVGLPTIMNWIGRWLLAINFRQAGLRGDVDISKVKITGGQIELTEASLSTELRPLFSEP